MEIPARIIIIQKCDDCPYRETVRNSTKSYCQTGMFPIKDINTIPTECPLEEVDLDLDDEIDCGTDLYDD